MEASKIINSDYAIYYRNEEYQDKPVGNIIWKDHIYQYDTLVLFCIKLNKKYNI